MKCYYDLHIHSVLSPDGDEFMTPNNILNMAMLKNLDFIAITDHNCLLQLQTVKNIETSYDFIFIPGVEVTVKEGFDVLCYFRTFDDAEIFNQFIQGYLTDTFTYFSPADQVITDIYDNPIGTVKKGLLTSTLPYSVLYRKVKSLNGIALFAHINRASKSVLNNHKLDDFSFDGIEIEPRHKQAFLSDHPEYKAYLTLSNSDSHTLMSISERTEYLELEDKSLDAFFAYFEGGAAKMNELSLHILDICENSISANASLIEITIEENTKNNTYTITITDDGHGMNKKTLSQVSDPFFTTRTTRKVGLGISLFKLACELTGGTFQIDSIEHEGTLIKAEFVRDHVDRAPLGDIEDTLTVLLMNESGIDIRYVHIVDNQRYYFDSREVKQVLDDVPITDYNVILWIKNTIKEGLLSIQKEETK